MFFHVHDRGSILLDVRDWKISKLKLNKDYTKHNTKR